MPLGRSLSARATLVRCIRPENNGWVMRAAGIDVEIQVAGGSNVGIERLRQLHVDRSPGRSPPGPGCPVKAAAPVTSILVSGPMMWAWVRLSTPLCSDARIGPCILERNALQSDGELVDLRVPAELLGLPQRTGHVDGASDRRISADALHMKCPQKGRDIEAGPAPCWPGYRSCPCRAVWPLT